MNTCENCKYWNRPRKESEIDKEMLELDIDGLSPKERLGLGRCKKVPQFWNATCWDSKGESRVFTEKEKDTKAFVQDGSDYDAELYTKKDFACNMHVIKNDSTDNEEKSNE